MKLLSFDTNTNGKDYFVSFLKSRLAIVDETTNSDEILDLIRFYEYDAIILSFTEDRMADIDILRKLRAARFHAPIMALARSLNEAARLRVLQAGADDLVVGALSHEEIFMKLQNLIRRSRGFHESSIRVGAVEINMNAKKIFVGDNHVTMTKKEYQIIEILALRKGAVLSKETILDHLYGGLDEPNPKIIDVFICKIRKKLAAYGVEDFIETNWGRGYMILEKRSIPAAQLTPLTPPTLTWPDKQRLQKAIA